MGTRFMTAQESTLIPRAHRRLLLGADDAPQGGREGPEGEAERRSRSAESYRPTVLTRVFSGRAARGFHNEMIAAFNEEAGEVPPLPWAVQASQVQPSDSLPPLLSFLAWRGSALTLRCCVVVAVR